MNFLGNTNELILIDKNMKSVTKAHPVNVMLTPQFYTLKREALPVKYAYQAKRVAASLFEGLLEDKSEYQYFVYKEEDEWVFVAYDLAKIQSFLSSKGLEAEQVAKIFFAQQAAASFTSPVLLDENSALVNLEGTMVIVPKVALGEDSHSVLKVNNSFTPTKGVALEGGTGSFLSQQQAVSLAAVFLLFSIMFMVEGWRYGGDSETQALEVQALLEEYPSLESSYTRESILSKYRQIDSLERKKRDSIKVLSHMIFKGSTLISLTLDDKKFQAQFSCENDGVIKKLKELAQKEKFNTSKMSNKKALQIEGTL